MMLAPTISLIEPMGNIRREAALLLAPIETLAGPMRQNQKRQKPTCPLCGKRPATTKDHVPPKSIFLRKLPNDLITVRVCRTCNNEASQLDQEFPVYLSVFLGMDDPKHLSFWKDKALRSVKKNNKLRQQILADMRKADIKSPGGVIIGRETVVPWDKQKHDNFIRRITRGLYSHHYREVLAADTNIFVYLMRELDKDFQKLASLCELNTIGGDQFVYRYCRALDDSRGSMWFYLFHRAHLVLAMTMPGEISGTGDDN